MFNKNGDYYDDDVDYSLTSDDESNSIDVNSIGEKEGSIVEGKSKLQIKSVAQLLSLKHPDILSFARDYSESQDFYKSNPSAFLQLFKPKFTMSLALHISRLRTTHVCGDILLNDWRKAISSGKMTPDELVELLVACCKQDETEDKIFRNPTNFSRGLFWKPTTPSDHKSAEKFIQSLTDYEENNKQIGSPITPEDVKTIERIQHQHWRDIDNNNGNKITMALLTIWREKFKNLNSSTIEIFLARFLECWVELKAQGRKAQEMGFTFTLSQQKSTSSQSFKRKDNSDYKRPLESSSAQPQTKKPKHGETGGEKKHYCNLCNKSGHRRREGECPLWDPKKANMKYKAKKNGKNICQCNSPACSEIEYITSITPSESMIFNGSMILSNSTQVPVKFLVDSGSKRDYASIAIQDIMRKNKQVIKPNFISACSPIGGTCNDILGNTVTSLSFYNENNKSKKIDLILRFTKIRFTNK